MRVFIDEIEPTEMATYLEACYIETFGVQLDQGLQHMHNHSISELIALWKTCDRFHHESLMRVTKKTIEKTILRMGEKMSQYSQYRNFSGFEDAVKSFVGGFQALNAHSEIGGMDESGNKALTTFLAEVFCVSCGARRWREVAWALPLEFAVEASIWWCKEILCLEKDIIERESVKRRLP